uniref:Uncharacterized protein n=1 Tax=Anopheles christyi TaxID=43041 RepID=A0A182KI31_9DIPT
MTSTSSCDASLCALVSNDTDPPPAPIDICSSPDGCQANWFGAEAGISPPAPPAPTADAFRCISFKLLGCCRLCPLMLRSDFPRKPSRISISVGYGRRRSPCCQVSGAHIALEKLTSPESVLLL